jgi:hypothetical protein
MTQIRYSKEVLGVFVMRTVHGMTVLYYMSLDVGFISGFYEFWHRPNRGSLIPDARFRAEFVVLGASLLVQIVTLWASWLKFKTCSFRTAVVLFSAWFLLFLYHPWFGRAPISLQFYDPFDLRQVAFQVLTFVAWIVGYAIFPALRFLETRKVRKTRFRSNVLLKRDL